jgi:hypothetical protein
VTGTHASPLVRFLRDPSRSLAHAIQALAQAAAHAVPLALAVCALVAVALAVRFVVVRVRERRLARGARLLQVAVPPELEAEGALLLWSALHDLLRPRLARLLGGQPHLAWEIAADRGGSQFRLWIPSAVPPGLVERALASAWPGVTTTTLTQPATEESAASADTVGEDV